MPRFAYRALDGGGRPRAGQISTASRDGALDLLRRRGLVPVGIDEVAGDAGALARIASWSRRGKPHAGELLEFTRDFGVLLGAGVDVGRALAILGEAQGGPAAAIARRLLARVRGGTSVAEAMEAEPERFPSHYVGMIRAGEEGSSLAQVLARLTVMLERAADLRAQVRLSLAYPTIVLCLSVLTMVLMLVFVVPEFRPVFEHSGNEIPVTAQVLLGASEIATEWGTAIGIGTLALLLVLRLAGRSAALGAVLDWLLLRLPVIGGVLVRLETARFCRTLGTLVVNGVVLLDAARIATAAIGNRHLAAMTRSFPVGLAHGEDAVRALGRAAWLPERVRRIVRVGAESGRLGEMLVQVAEIYEAESARAMQRAVGMIAPATTMLLGGLIAVMIWSIISVVLGSYSQALQ